MLSNLCKQFKTMTVTLSQSVPKQQQRSLAYPPFRVMRRHPLSRRNTLSLLKATFGKRYPKSKGETMAIKSRCNRLVNEVRENFYTLGRGRKAPHIIPGLNQALPRIDLSTNWLKRMADTEPKQISEEFVEKHDVTKMSSHLWKMRDASRGRPERLKGASMDSWGEKGSGFTSYSIEGRSAGPPILPDGRELEGFRSVVLYENRVAHMTGAGKVHGVHVMVAVGNGKGLAGWAIAGATNIAVAVNHARNRAALRLRSIPVCDGHTIYHDMVGQQVRSVVKLERRPLGFGLRCGRTIREICKLAGIKDMRSKVMMNRNPLRVIPCVFKLLEAQETHQMLADRTGLHVVEYRRSNLYVPVVVASPSNGIVREDTEYVKEIYDTIGHKLAGVWPYSM
ncbi:hypothetical protein LOD99_16275 [Oopsacas minuta]|uniref:S5 DRBM domain-containing protein n=1 Tax=Oopsacas minuta TaxID=111878 RepID=A0AAV7K8T9_9METZ|nr:hypothetical protein LOD99_16275 [Oopsacas minuta]